MTNIWGVRELVSHVESGRKRSTATTGKWKPTRPADRPGLFRRIKAALLVLNDRADAVVWEA